MSRVSYVDAVIPDTGPRIPAGRTEPTEGARADGCQLAWNGQTCLHEPARRVRLEGLPVHRGSAGTSMSD